MTVRTRIDPATLTCELPDGLTAARAGHVADQVVYSSEDVTGVRLEQGARRIHLSYRPGTDTVRLRELVLHLATEAAAERVPAVRVLRRTESGPDGAGPAVAGGADPDAVAVLHHAYDRLFRELGRTVDARERVYPAMIDLALMDRCRYVEMFPQNAYLVDELPHERDVLTRMRSGELDRESVRRSTPYLLNPALCFHSYAELEGTSIGEPVVLGVTGQCFRHEAPWRLDRYRRANFTMREIPFLGSPPAVAELRDTLRDRVWEIFTELGLRGGLVTAADPFYHSDDSAIRQHQLMAVTKYELVVDSPGGASAAIASFNNIRDALCRQFGITVADGAPAHSGCAAFGIDRWVQATLDRHGDRRSRWPAELTRHCD